VSLNGFLTVTNGSQIDSLALPIDMPANANESFDLSKFGLTELLNSFTDEFPDTFKFSGNSIVNNEYTSGSVNQKDSLTSNIELQIPFDVGIAGGIIRDTIKLDSLEIKDKDINSVESLNLTFDFENSIPFSLVLQGFILDEIGNNILTIPPEYNTTDNISILAPQIGENGFVESPTNSKQTIELRGEDARIFLRSTKMFMNFDIITPPAYNNNPVKFRNTDYLHIKVYGEIYYLFNTNEESR
jgi:hypothetical protein